MMPTMKLRHEISYDAPLADVYAMLADPAFRQASATAMGVISADVTITPNGEGMSVHIDQVQPTEGVPGFAKKFAGETTRAVQTEEWGSPVRRDHHHRDARQADLDQGHAVARRVRRPHHRDARRRGEGQGAR